MTKEFNIVSYTEGMPIRLGVRQQMENITIYPDATIVRAGENIAFFKFSSMLANLSQATIRVNMENNIVSRLEIL
jgi:hypothetical protein